jgi:hypothetical protein
MGENSEVISKLTQQVPSRGTELDQQCAVVFECVIQLVMAANKNLKHQFIAIAANAIHSVGEISKRVELVLHAHAPNTHLTAATRAALPFTQQLVRQKLRQLNEKLTIEHPRRLMVKTRLSIGAWPPTNSVSEMVEAAAALAITTRKLVEIANILGHYPLLDRKIALNVGGAAWCLAWVSRGT